MPSSFYKKLQVQTAMAGETVGKMLLQGKSSLKEAEQAVNLEGANDLEYQIMSRTVDFDPNETGKSTFERLSNLKQSLGKSPR